MHNNIFSRVVTTHTIIENLLRPNHLNELIEESDFSENEDSLAVLWEFVLLLHKTTKRAITIGTGKC